MNTWIARYITLLFILLCVWTDKTHAHSRKEKKQEEKKELTSYEKLFEGKKVETAGNDWISLHKMEGKVYGEYFLKYLEREILIASTVTSSTNGMFCSNGYKENVPMHLQVDLKGNDIIFKQVNAIVEVDSTDSRMQKLKNQNFEFPALFKYEILAFSPDSASVVFDMTDLFIDQEKALNPLPKKTMGYSLDATIDKKLSSIQNIKVFEDNISILSQLAYRYGLKNQNNYIVLRGALTITATRTILLLPKQKMTPRISDPRIGTFLTKKRKFTKDGRILNYTYANRWDLQPKDEIAYRQGKMVEPQKPITFYMDTLFPASWQQPIREGVLRWNQAFEKIGFKNAIQVKDFPRHDPEFDPDNLKYSCIRYVPQPTKNAMGPSWADPNTGEILNATVFIYSNVIDMLRDWRFIQTAQLDKSARSQELSPELLEESLAYVVSHEIGHCLGLMHNMSASYAYPVDSLRSVSFTQKYGTTPSIMDYARFNYVAQPTDIGVRLSPPNLGVYDEFAIRWLYTPIYANTSEEEMTILKQWIDEKMNDPRYRYGQQQIWSRYDPSALEEDLGNDAIKASDYGISNLQYILPNLKTWIQHDKDFQCRQQLYQQLILQYARYIRNVLANVGGIYLFNIEERTDKKRFVPVSKELQQNSMTWVMNQLHNLTWLNDKNILTNITLTTPPSLDICELVSELISMTPMRVALSATWSDNPYSLADFFDDFYQGVWDSAIQERKVTPEDKVLQRMYLQQVEEYTNELGSNPLWLSNNEKYEYVLEKLGIDHEWQEKIDTQTIDEISTYYHDSLNKLKTLLESKMEDFHCEDRAYYEMILYATQQILGQHKHQN